MTPLRVLAVASEIYPIVKTGGLADVVGALPAALQADGIETRTLVPGYPDVIAALAAAEELLHLPSGLVNVEDSGGPAIGRSPCTRCLARYKYALSGAGPELPFADNKH